MHKISDGLSDRSRAFVFRQCLQSIAPEREPRGRWLSTAVPHMLFGREATTLRELWVCPLRFWAAALDMSCMTLLRTGYAAQRLRPAFMPNAHPPPTPLIQAESPAFGSPAWFWNPARGVCSHFSHLALFLRFFNANAVSAKWIFGHFCTGFVQGRNRSPERQFVVCDNCGPRYL
jgi:hypothetical protein